MEVMMRGNTLDQVVRQIREGISSGALASGQRLIEADLTRDLGVGRSSIREAFRLLAAEGLLESIPNKGTIVRRFTRREIMDLFDIRLALECLTARLAATRIDIGRNRSRFLTTIRPLDEDHSDYTRSSFLSLNKAFHEQIAGLSGNQKLADLVGQLQLPLLMFQLNFSYTRATFSAARAEHKRISAAILKGSASKAESAMKHHLLRARDMIESMPTTAFRS